MKSSFCFVLYTGTFRYDKLIAGFYPIEIDKDRMDTVDSMDKNNFNIFEKDLLTIFVMTGTIVGKRLYEFVWT